MTGTVSAFVDHDADCSPGRRTLRVAARRGPLERSRCWPAVERYGPPFTASIGPPSTI